ncbi:MAG: hypothetical protein WBX11_09905 [Thiobacillaceae bacterium]
MARLDSPSLCTTNHQTCLFHFSQKELFGSDIPAQELLWLSVRGTALLQQDPGVDTDCVDTDAAIKCRSHGCVFATDAEIPASPFHLEIEQP